ncbi:vitamin-D-receptor interacting mediator subunit 4-domain-containing protein [Talaromyces proteolyticus]|uniref:Mediator of RNA polymerase II transcription subunit 4 n=1 Tax=Talaromyces proteolyticus TaxID=1131652 RepID=A0AAD4KEU7_9EURO|nr:vitamin-D-receptor interacting mediator subunit 4-domain-containing protein [Talaromyces proteolyticus]KAH8689442.1 vitamin-D-receptor interacting mediator subunit 4-domain-containing protein [Talaromyces proteolyticus]
MNTQLTTALDGLENKLNSLLSSLTTPSAAGAPTAAIALLEADDVVTSALDTLRIHQANYTKILRLRAEAESLEERIKGIVRDISVAGQEVADATGDSDDDYTDEDSETDTESDDEVAKSKPKKGRRKEVDYRLLLDFARRISKYNKQAAADAATGIGSDGTKKLQEKQTQDTDMTDDNGIDTTDHDGQEVTVGTVTKEATSWLEESADADRQVFMIPYPNEDRIRMGLMGQLQMTAMDQNLDVEKEAERMVQEAEGTALSGGEAAGQDNSLANESSKTATHAGARVTERGPAPTARAPAPQLKATLDLDLYDPDEDD